MGPAVPPKHELVEIGLVGAAKAVVHAQPEMPEVRKTRWTMEAARAPPPRNGLRHVFRPFIPWCDEKPSVRIVDPSTMLSATNPFSVSVLKLEMTDSRSCFRRENARRALTP